VWLVLGSLTLKEFALQKKIFKFFDQNEDGFISEDELKGAWTRVFIRARLT
jgi:Ca2+-binding EF-hand superfamily protein